MLIDSNQVFDPSGTALTATAVSTNVLDAGLSGGVPSVQGRDIGIGLRALRVRVVVQTALLAAGAATLTVQVEAAPDNGSGAPGTYAILAQTDAIPKASLVAGAFIDLPLPPQPPQAENAPPEESGPPRFYRLNYVVGTGPFTAGTIEAWLGDGMDNNQSYSRNYSTSGM